jgi:hypothetical protein
VKEFRRICRTLHREFGFFIVGLTLIYAVSGLAVNHAHHWDANYSRSVEHSRIEAPGTGSTESITPLVLERLKLDEPFKNTWRAAPDKLQVFLERSTLTVNLETGEVRRDGFRKRPLLYQLNFMHLNSGKGAWTVFADVYASILIVMALTGIFLVRGKRGLSGRGAWLMGAGFLLPIAYMLIAGR